MSTGILKRQNFGPPQGFLSMDHWTDEQFYSNLISWSNLQRFRVSDLNQFFQWGFSCQEYSLVWTFSNCQSDRFWDQSLNDGWTKLNHRNAREYIGVAAKILWELISASWWAKCGAQIIFLCILERPNGPIGWSIISGLLKKAYAEAIGAKKPISSFADIKSILSTSTSKQGVENRTKCSFIHGTTFDKVSVGAQLGLPAWSASVWYWYIKRDMTDLWILLNLVGRSRVEIVRKK